MFLSHDCYAYILRIAAFAGFLQTTDLVILKNPPWLSVYESLAGQVPSTSL